MGDTTEEITEVSNSAPQISAESPKDHEPQQKLAEEVTEMNINEQVKETLQEDQVMKKPTGAKICSETCLESSLNAEDKTEEKTSKEESLLGVQTMEEVHCQQDEEKEDLSKTDSNIGAKEDEGTISEDKIEEIVKTSVSEGSNVIPQEDIKELKPSEEDTLGKSDITESESQKHIPEPTKDIVTNKDESETEVILEMTSDEKVPDLQNTFDEAAAEVGSVKSPIVIEDMPETSDDVVVIEEGNEGVVLEPGQVKEYTTEVSRESEVGKGSLKKELAKAEVEKTSPDEDIVEGVVTDETEQEKTIGIIKEIPKIVVDLLKKLNLSQLKHLYGIFDQKL